MPKCSFCSKQYSEHKGVMIVDSVKGDISYFCSSKCRKNAKMKRRKKKWTIPISEK